MLGEALALGVDLADGAGLVGLVFVGLVFVGMLLLQAPNNAKQARLKLNRNG
jgi:hypothetical protein